MTSRWTRMWITGAVPVIVLSLVSTASAATVWHVLPTANPGAGQVSDITLEAVSAFNATDAWAVGIDQVGAFRVPLAEHWDGTRWRAVPVPKPSGRRRGSRASSTSAPRTRGPSA